MATAGGVRERLNICLEFVYVGSILLFDPRREHSSAPTAKSHSRRAQGLSRLAASSRTPEGPGLVWGPRRQALISHHSTLPSFHFLCSTWNPVSSPRPTRVGGRRAQGLSRSAVALAWRHAQSFQAGLDCPEHGGTLVVVGMTRPRGARCRGTRNSRRNLVSGGSH